MRSAGALVFVAVLAVGACSGGANSKAESTSTSNSNSVESTVGSATDCGSAARTPARDAAYGGDALQRIDVYPPAHADGCTPVVVWVHGGGWRKGDKLATAETKARLFSDAGWTFASVNYRLTDVADPNPIRYPTHNEDVAAAIAFLVEHAGEYGIDPDRIALLGHSAGAGIVAAVATDPVYLGAHDLGLDTLACAGPLDTEGFDVAATASGVGSQAQLYQSVFGTDPDRWTEASPISHVVAGAGIAPMVVVRRGAQERQDQLDEFVAALRAAGVAVTVIDGSTVSHEQVNRNIGADGDTVMTEPLMAFLHGCLD
jgi:arylformamidase